MKATLAMVRKRIAELENDVVQLREPVPVPSWVHRSWVDLVPANELKETLDKVQETNRQRLAALKLAERELEKCRLQLWDLEEEQ